MIDRSVYETQIITQNLSVDYLRFDRYISYLTGEYLWNASLKYLSREVGLSPDVIFGAISAIVIFAFSITIARSVGLPCIVFLVNPLVVDFAFSQLRLALVMGVMLILVDFYLHRPIRAAVAAVILSAVHTAAVLFFFIGGIARLVAAKSILARSYLVLALPVLTGVLVAVVTGPARGVILGAVEDRRAVYLDMSSSVTYLLFWVCLLAVLVFRWKWTSNRFVTSLSIAVLSIVLTNIIISGYSTRFIAATFPFLVASMFSLDGIYRVAVSHVFIIYVVYQWVYWLRLLG